MSTIKLTQPQQEVLDAINQGAQAIYMPYAGQLNPEAYWFLDMTYKRCTKQVERLIKLGLVKVIKMDKYGSDKRVIALTAQPPAAPQRGVAYD